MDARTFEEVFAVAVGSEGAAYVAARKSLVDEGPRVLSTLRAKASSREDWRVTLTAAAMIAWISERDVCDKVADLMRGNLETKTPARPITGAWPEGPRGIAIAALGPRATPRIVEVLSKTREYTNDVELEALLIALGRLRDPRAVLPLIEFMRGHLSPEAKSVAAHALGEIGDPRAFSILSENLLNGANGLQVRVTSARSLGMLKERQAVEPLLQVFSNEQNEGELRAEAVSALGRLGDPRAGTQLAARVATVRNPELLQTLLSTLGDLCDSSCLPTIERVAQSHPDSLVRQEAAAARKAILGRAGKGSGEP